VEQASIGGVVCLQYGDFSMKAGSAKRGTARGKIATSHKDRKQATPTTGVGTRVVVPMGEELIERLDSWCRAQPKETSRADAIRFLLDESLPKGAVVHKKMATS
jgi:hypothetical protein